MRKPHALLKRAILLLCSAWTIWAAPIIPTSYSLANGEEGYWIYQDTTYLPCPASSCTTSGAPLAGGTGMLTDGFTPAFAGTVPVKLRRHRYRGSAGLVEAIP